MDDVKNLQETELLTTQATPNNIKHPLQPPSPPSHYYTGNTGNSAHKPNDVEQCHNDGARSADALTGAPTLAPIGTHNQEQSSPVNKSTRSQSPSIDGNKIGSDQEDQ